MTRPATPPALLFTMNFATATCFQKKRTADAAQFALAAFAHPRGGESADEEQQPDQSGEYRQHADAAHHARLARAQSQPVVTVVGVARAHRDDARQMNAAAALDPYDVAARRIGKRGEHLGRRRHLSEFARIGGAYIGERVERAVARTPQPELACLDRRAPHAR